MQRISVTLPDEVVDVFYTKIEKGHRSKFIADAIRAALHKEEKLQAYQSLANFTPFTIEEDSTEGLRQIRENRQKENVEKGK